MGGGIADAQVLLSRRLYGLESSLSLPAQKNAPHIKKWQQETLHW
jgi:hypothetical protein